jgi:hypothetical protein
MKNTIHLLSKGVPHQTGGIKFYIGSEDIKDRTLSTHADLENMTPFTAEQCIQANLLKGHNPSE